MKVRNAVSCLIVAGLVLSSAPAGADSGPWIVAPGEYSSEFRGSTGSGDTYYDSEGARSPLAGGLSLESRGLAADNELGWKKSLSLVIRLPAESVTWRTDSPASHSTATGLSDLVFGLKWGILRGKTAVALEAGWQAPLGYERDAAPSLGPGVQQGIGRLHLGSALPGGFGFFQLAGGYRYRAEELGDVMEGAADVGFWLGESILFSGHYDLAMGLGDEPRPSTHVVGPELRYRLDDRLDLFVGTRHTAAGKNALHVDAVYIGLAAKHSSLNRLQGYQGGKRRP